ncbi:unnamed protein product [Calicophoron daubneyi]|uniref:ribonuclease Z n=1 Tax=Calicophoron daubneyi TaxID=300641 RepID=A0AAV2TTT4_CALDB
MFLEGRTSLRSVICFVRRHFRTSGYVGKHYKAFLDPMRPPAAINLMVVGTGSKGSPKSIIIDTGITRYLINAGEGTQRILTEQKSKASRLQHVFFTQMSWDYVSGLLGVALTARTAGVKKLTVHGPPKIGEVMQLSRHFADSETTDIVKSEILQKPFEDPAFRVQAFPICQLHETEEPESKRPKGDAFDHTSRTTYAYYFQPFQQGMKLDKDRCISIGIPRKVYESPLVRDLLEGKTVTLPGGTIIDPKDVTVPAPLTPNFLIIDCPTPEFIPAFKQNAALMEALGAKSGTPNLHPGLSLVVHLTPEGLFNSDDYQSLVQLLDEVGRTNSIISQHLTDLGSHLVHHLVLDGSSRLPAFTGIYSQSTILNHYFDTKAYPLLYDIQTEDHRRVINEAAATVHEPFPAVVFAHPHLQYSLRPWNGFNSLEYPSLDRETLIDGAFDLYHTTRAEAEEQFKVMRSKMAESMKTLGSGEKNPEAVNIEDDRIPAENYPELTFLGTGSSSPNKYRNISCILVKLSSEDFIMLDCGEGTLNQLYALYGAEEASRILCRLRLILITHMHADHHGGVFSTALARTRLLGSMKASGRDMGPPVVGTLPVLAPPTFARWMTTVEELFRHGPAISLFVIPNVYESPCPLSIHPPICPLKPESPRYAEWTSILNRLKLQVGPVRVPHTGSSWAFVIRGERSALKDTKFNIVDGSESNDWCIVYSGDTTECDDLVQAGQNCDLLIHEATMGDEHSDLAVRARHSTVGGALRIGKDMKAKFILLNHFSQRYGRLSPLDKFIPNVAATFDFMRYLIKYDIESTWAFFTSLSHSSLHEKTFFTLLQVNFKDLLRLPFYMPYYKYAFSKHWDTQLMKTEAYTWRKFRERSADQNSDTNPSAPDEQIACS